MPYAVAYFVPILVILVSIPMVLGKVPPNKLYGFRTPKTLSSPEIWYPANRASGWFMIAASVVSISLNSALLLLLSDGNEETLMAWQVGSTMVLLLLSLAASFLYLRYLRRLK